MTTAAELAPAPTPAKNGPLLALIPWNGWRAPTERLGEIRRLLGSYTFPASDASLLCREILYEITQASTDGRLRRFQLDDDEACLDPECEVCLQEQHLGAAVDDI